MPKCSSSLTTLIHSTSKSLPFEKLREQLFRWTVDSRHFHSVDLFRRFEWLTACRDLRIHPVSPVWTICPREYCCEGLKVCLLGIRSCDTWGSERCLRCDRFRRIYVHCPCKRGLSLISNRGYEHTTNENDKIIWNEVIRRDLLQHLY